MYSDSIHSSLKKLSGRGLSALSISLQVYWSLNGVTRERTASFTVEPEILEKTFFCSSGVGAGVLVVWIPKFDLVAIGVTCFSTINSCFFLADVKSISLTGNYGISLT